LEPQRRKGHKGKQEIAMRTTVILGRVSSLKQGIERLCVLRVLCGSTALFGVNGRYFADPRTTLASDECL
jgi:hypothetical protein